MIGHHVAQCASRLVKGSAPLYADRLRRCNLHVVDAVAIPHRLEDAIGETKSHDVLDCVLAEKVVDPENLILVQRPQDLRIQRARRIEAMSERLFDHHPAPEFGGRRSGPRPGR